MAVLTKKLSAVIGSAIAPYLEKYFKKDDKANASLYNLAMMTFRENSVDMPTNVIGVQFFDRALVFSKRTLENSFLNNLLSISVDGGVSTLNGNLRVTGTINGVTTASLVSLDDLKDVLTASQIAKLEAKVQQRIAVAKVSDSQLNMGGGGIKIPLSVSSVAFVTPKEKGGWHDRQGKDSARVPKGTDADQHNVRKYPGNLGRRSVAESHSIGNSRLPEQCFVFIPSRISGEYRRDRGFRSLPIVRFLDNRYSSEWNDRRRRFPDPFHQRRRKDSGFIQHKPGWSGHTVVRDIFRKSVGILEEVCFPILTTRREVVA